MQWILLEKRQNYDITIVPDFIKKFDKVNPKMFSPGKGYQDANITEEIYFHGHQEEVVEVRNHRSEQENEGCPPPDDYYQEDGEWESMFQIQCA